MSYKKGPIEIVAPAGSPEALDAAVGEGADAVYCGVREFNARMRAKNFSYNQLEAAVEKLHELNRKLYVTVNTVVEEREVKYLYNLLKYLEKIRVDAVIVQDAGVIELIEQNFPSLKIHASTQMNISSAQGMNFLSRRGVKRVVLSRELSFEEIGLIRKQTNTEIELFVHGALCISLSGVCLFSSYFGGKSANRGQCVQACRRLFLEPDTGKKGYYFSPKDLMLIEHVPAMIECGVDSLKIEGRMKSYQYIATVVKGYRYLIDNYQNISSEEELKKLTNEAKEILKDDFARSKTAYYFLDKKNRDFLTPEMGGQTGIYIGTVKKIVVIEEKRYALIQGKTGELEKNDMVRFHDKEDTSTRSAKVDDFFEKDSAFYLKVPEEVKKEDDLFLTSKHSFTGKYPKLLPKSLTKYKRHPGVITPPAPQRMNINPRYPLENGIYVKTNNLNHIHLIQGRKPEKLIFHVNYETYNKIDNQIKQTSLTPADIILYLEPHMFEGDQWVKESIEYFVQKGYKYFVANNYGHLHLLHNKDVTLIAGPYLYGFNSYAAAFMLKQGASYLINPLESNKQNLYGLTEPFNRKQWFVTLFSFPELFHIRTDMTGHYDIKMLADKDGSYEYIIHSVGGITSVLPQKPFSITDKAPDLIRKGFGKFIIDIAFMDLKKNNYKHLLEDALQGRIMEGTERFNWKRGFSS